MIVRDNDRFVRDVRQVLTVAEVGLRWKDNIAPVAEFRYLESRAPYYLLTTLVEAPLSVLVLRAVNRDTRTIESGCRITWTWDGSYVRVSAMDVVTPASEYDVTLGLVR